MRNVWLALGFVGTLAVGLLAGLLLGVFTAGGEQGTATPSPRTVTVERTVPAPGPSPRASAPAQNVGSLDDARGVFEEAVEGYGNPNLEVAEVMEFANNYYAEVREKDTGIGAMELLIDKPGGWVYPEPGPNMMWNTKYGMMPRGGGYGMMGPGGQGMMGPNRPGQTRQGAPAEQMTVSPEHRRGRSLTPTSGGSRRARRREKPKNSTATTRCTPKTMARSRECSASTATRARS